MNPTTGLFEIRERTPLELLRTIRDIATTHPDRFDMATWGYIVTLSLSHCGTTYCIGGWTVYLTPGWRLHWEGNYLQTATEPGTGHVHEIPLAARRILGLNRSVAGELFHEANHDALRYLKAIIRLAERGEDLADIERMDVWDEMEKAT